MELRLKLWHIIAFFSVVIISGSIFLGVWVRDNDIKIGGLKKEIKQYDVRIAELKEDYDFLAKSDAEKTVIIDSLVAEIDEKDKAIKGLKWSIRKIKTELQYEKERIIALDSAQQFELLRTNLDIMLRRAGGESR